MKPLLTFLFLAISAVVFSQAPQSIPYQAVVRNTDGSTMANAAVTITFKIHDNGATGTVVYEETHATTTNAQGLVSLNVGGGTAMTGTFSGIQWGTGSKFLQVLMNAGNGVIDLGTQQMMSVPYALYAEDVNVRVSVTGDSLFIGDQVSIVPGVSAANPVSISNYGYVLLPGNTTCQNEYISVTGCGGQDSLLYYDRYYSLVEIGGQCWFAENLATDKFANGDNIPTGLTNTQWQNTTSGAYAIYNNDIANDAIYGKLYNWYTTVDSRSVCPAGWHVPSDCEWMFLEGFLGISTIDQQTIEWRGFNAGGVLKSVNYWTSPNIGVQYSGQFNFFPGGFRDDSDGYYKTMGGNGYVWSKSVFNNGQSYYAGYYRLLSNAGQQIYRHYDASRNDGISIRCIKD
jgi:uncharacterized protein (TIGR02145 family)